MSKAFDLLRDALNLPVVNQFIKWSIVGTIGAGVDYGILILLHEGFGVDVVISKAISFTAAVINNFVLNRTWTFRGGRHKDPAVQLTQFFVVSTGGFFITMAIFTFLVKVVHIQYLISNAIAIIIVLIWNFFVNRAWTFREVD
jgi:dolichol-phosphate mannosyltransferase